MFDKTPALLARIAERMRECGFAVRGAGNLLTLSKGGHSGTCTFEEFLEPRFSFAPEDADQAGLKCAERATGPS